jgi:hypothetical protein
MFKKQMKFNKSAELKKGSHTGIFGMENHNFNAQ